MRRREFMASLSAAPLSSLVSRRPAQPAPRTGRLKQALFRSAFDPNASFEAVCRTAVDLGAYGFDAIESRDWPTLKRFGLAPTLAFPEVTPPPFLDGIAHGERHAPMEAVMHTQIDRCAREGCGLIPVAGGQRRGMSYEEGADNTVAFLNRIKAHAEDKGITVCIEVMNKFDRPDQTCDHLAWAIQVLQRVGSSRVKLLFDIYHIQIADGDIVRHIRDNIQWIAHFHTAGVPGRHEIDDTQELNYRFIAHVIADLGFAGYVAHEYTPTPGRDPLMSIKRTLDIMNV